MPYWSPKVFRYDLPEPPVSRLKPGRGDAAGGRDQHPRSLKAPIGVGLALRALGVVGGFLRSGSTTRGQLIDTARDRFNAMYDLIGDIHGHADALRELLRQLGYAKQEGVYGHPERKVLFLGDFIDRGPKIRETLEIVRPMVESGAALAVMGNHELNALAFHTPDPTKPGEHLRPHNEKNSHQHAETMRQVPAGELASYLDWFRTLPLWLDLDGLRVVHACWDETRMAKISGPITDEFLYSACLPRGTLFEPVEAILKGKEAHLPPGATFRDKDGHERTATRVKWYEAPHGHTYRTYAMASETIESDLPLPEEVVQAAVPYPEDAKPVFVGHYWLTGRQPELLRRNIACVDWSVAKGGFLCAYRWDGEQDLDAAKFVWTG